MDLVVSAVNVGGEGEIGIRIDGIEDEIDVSG